MKDELIKQALKGDKESFTAAVLDIKDQAYRIAQCYLHNEQDSMDAVCDAVEKAYINLHRLKVPEMFATWFIRIVINQCKLHKRKNDRLVSMEDSGFNDECALPVQHEGDIDLRLAMSKLKPGDRVLIYMKYYLGYTLEEIASATNMPVGTVKTKIYSNLKCLKKFLVIKEGTDYGLSF